LPAQKEPNDKSLHCYGASNDYGITQNCVIPLVGDNISGWVVLVKQTNPVLPVQPVARKVAVTAVQDQIVNGPKRKDKRPPFRLDNEQSYNRAQPIQEQTTAQGEVVNYERLGDHCQGVGYDLPHTHK